MQLWHKLLRVILQYSQNYKILSMLIILFESILDLCIFMRIMRNIYNAFIYQLKCIKI